MLAQTRPAQIISYPALVPRKSVNSVLAQTRPARIIISRSRTNTFRTKRDKNNPQPKKQPQPAKLSHALYGVCEGDGRTGQRSSAARNDPRDDFVNSKPSQAGITKKLIARCRIDQMVILRAGPWCHGTARMNKRLSLKVTWSLRGSFKVST